MSVEKRISDMIEAEVSVRVAKAIGAALARVGKRYDISLSQLLKDTSGYTCTFCNGANKGGTRCLKPPQPNGYCKFHTSQAPSIPVPSQERVKAPWEA